MTTPDDKTLDELVDRIVGLQLERSSHDDIWEALRDSASAIAALRERIAALEAERDALRQDAARYRWLRDGAECDVIFGDPEYEDRYAHVESLLALDDLDAAIDAALKDGKL